jgi:hypothetical protein
LHRKSILLLELLKTHFPDQVGGAQGWNFEKAHNILHKVHKIVMWGWSENTSCQGPEHAHIDIIKSVVHLTNNKDEFLCILCYHCRSVLLQQYKQLLEDLVGQGEACTIQMDMNGKGLDWGQKFQYFLQIGSAISFSAGHDEPGRFASVCVSEIALILTYFFNYNVYGVDILYIYYVYIMYILS